MNEKDKQLMKDSAIVIADGIASIVPGLSIAWNLTKSLLGVGMEIRQQRALEWIEMIRANPSIFSKQILESEDFQDGFVYSIEQYLRQRVEFKRRLIKSVFLGFAVVPEKNEFELERIIQMINILSLGDIEVLKDVNPVVANFHQLYDNTLQKNENIYNLINAGILISDYQARVGPIQAPFVKITEFGKTFIQFILHDKNI